MKKVLIGVICGMIATVLLAFAVGIHKSVVNKKNIDTMTEAEMPNNDSNLHNNILITAAHIGGIEGYTLIYQDDKRDVAYYIANSLELTEIQEQEVSIEGLDECKVVKSEPGIFYVSTETPEQIVNGMSGTRVYAANGTPIGFVDALVQDQLLKCITLE